jgi:tetratricopeptide (TPR) repeat protein
VLGLGAGIFGGPERWGDLPELIRAGFGERIALDGLLERTDPGVDAGSTTTASVTPRAHEADPDWHALLERAISHSEAGRDEEAEASFINALFEAEKLDVDHPGLTSVLDHFGYFYDQRQRYEEAIPLYLRALDGYRASVGEEHEYFVGIERRIAYAYRAQGRVAEALLHLSAAVTATIALSGDHGIEVAYGYKEIGDLRRMAGDEASAQADYRRALRAARETLPDDHELVMLLEEYLGER